MGLLRKRFEDIKAHQEEVEKLKIENNKLKDEISISEIRIKERDKMIVKEIAKRKELENKLRQTKIKKVSEQIQGNSDTQ